ncbi:hypothetical protein FGO68_gene8661 [Halteria grandinella]|uniref:Uncharacterized protein n=1 Tax=Halteria grandinella TaxID=5974 RepID=A0A8J8NDS2_HALGN|nr:hypothetical protein FGO68_gene8661 [Halteria grandinella]
MPFVWQSMQQRGCQSLLGQKGSRQMKWTGGCQEQVQGFKVSFEQRDQFSGRGVCSIIIIILNGRQGKRRHLLATQRRERWPTQSRKRIQKQVQVLALWQRCRHHQQGEIGKTEEIQPSSWSL